MGFEGTRSAERPARPAVRLVLHYRYSSEVSPVARRGRGATASQVERSVLASVVGGRAVLALAQGPAAEAEVCRPELVPCKMESKIWTLVNMVAIRSTLVFLKGDFIGLPQTTPYVKNGKCEKE